MALMDLLPEWYRKSPQVVELQGAFDHWAEALAAARDELLAQLNVATATWGLELWERDLGLDTDVSRPLEYRRARIMSKLRGLGTTTKSMIQNVAESFTNGEVAIIEYSRENRFEVKFVGTLGIPPNLDDLTAAINEIKPAHLAYSFIFFYRTHDGLAPFTHAQLGAYTHEELRSRGDIGA